MNQPMPRKWTIGELQFEVKQGKPFAEMVEPSGWTLEDIARAAIEHRWLDPPAPPPKPKTPAEMTPEELRAHILALHRADWEKHRSAFGLYANTEDMRTGKTAAEMLKVRHEGERRAWELADEYIEDALTKAHEVTRKLAEATDAATAANIYQDMMNTGKAKKGGK